MAESTIKVYDGEELIVDAVLCRNAEGEIGWYDHIGEKFYPTPLERCEFRTQYIDTGYVPASLVTCDGCIWSNRKRPQKCSCCRRNRGLKDCYERREENAAD